MEPLYENLETGILALVVSRRLRIAVRMRLLAMAAAYGCSRSRAASRGRCTFATIQRLTVWTTSPYWRWTATGLRLCADLGPPVPPGHESATRRRLGVSAGHRRGFACGCLRRAVPVGHGPTVHPIPDECHHGGEYAARTPEPPSNGSFISSGCKAGQTLSRSFGWPSSFG